MTKTDDALAKHWTDALPEGPRAYAQLSRLDRPIGWQLLWLPCLMGLSLARSEDGFFWDDLTLAALFFIGAIAMRGAGCTWNDLLDRDIDAKVARTALRPIPSGRVSPANAAIWLVLQLCVALIVWLGLSDGALPNLAQWIALAALPLVGAYPMMKRITWWPQVWLGLVFSWGLLMGAAAIDKVIGPDTLLAYAGCVAWTIAYDTIYALQDKDDDALIGVRSTARLFGAKWRGAVLAFYVAALFLWAAAIVMAGAAPHAGLIILALTGGVLIWRAVDSVRDDLPETALAAFRSNGLIGVCVLLAIAADPLIRTFGPLL
jgi:4-hydroxybenzoate polyprenyltransferase